MADILDLAGRTALVTGASSGLGRHFAALLAARGAKVALAARRKELLDEAAAEIRASGGTAATVAMDVTDEASVIAAYDAVEVSLGPVDTVIANAGMNSRGLATQISIDEVDQVMAVNFRGVFLTAREGARRMIARDGSREGQGRVVLIASIGGLAVLPGLTPYCASKAAVVMTGKSSAREWINRGVNVNVICPGYIETDINADWFAEEGGQRQMAGFPRKRLMRETDLDGLLLFLASDASRGITGSVFTADDGQTL